VCARTAAMAALFFVFEIIIIHPEHARAAMPPWQDALPAKSRAAGDVEIIKISDASKDVHFPVAAKSNGRIIDRLVFHFDDCTKTGTDGPLIAAEASSDFRAHRPSIGSTFLSDENSIRERAELSVGLPDVPDADARSHRFPALEQRLALIQMTQGYMDDANSRPVNQNKGFSGNLRLISGSLGGRVRRIHCDGSGISGLFGYRNRLLHVVSVDLRDPPQAIRRSPEGASENCRGNDGESSDCIVVEPRPKPMPTSDDQMNKQGTNGLILIAGIAVALCIAFRRKPPPFRSERHRHESDSTESG
jgi:hypothetical protein